MKAAGFPVPAPLALCRDCEVLGSMFYVMEFVGGDISSDALFPGETPPARRLRFEAMIGTLARLHRLDPKAIGLGDFGRPDGYLARSVKRWSQQYRLTATDDLPAMEALIEWLPRKPPASRRLSIIHGDYRLDNVIFREDGVKIAAVLDWELATLGDPFADFANFLMYWYIPANGRSAIYGVDHEQLGIPTVPEVIAMYGEILGVEEIPQLDWYIAHGLFRLAAILQGVVRRGLDGSASNIAATSVHARIQPLSELAWQFALKAGA